MTNPILLQKDFNLIVLIWTLIALIIFPILLKVKAPYGRHTSEKWGRLIDNRTGWLIMELPSLLLFTILSVTGNPSVSGAGWIFFSAWVIHYINRIFIFPFRTRTRGKKMPIMIVVLAALFNLMNGFLNGYWLGNLSANYNAEWLTDPRFILGISLFITGFVINQASDNHLIHLRSNSSKGYYIPVSKLFKYVSCPNFSGEIIEWSGFALMTWSLPGLSFAVWTAANLIPRALHHHKWYHEYFHDYPARRKAIIPGIL